MNVWSFISNMFALTPEQEVEYHQLELDYGLVDPTPAEQAQMEWEDILNYLEWMPTEKDVWYDGEFTGYYQYYKTDQFGHRHNVSDVRSWYCGHVGEPPSYDIVPVCEGEVVDEYIPVYMRLQGAA